MASMVQVNCKQCNKEFNARTADRNRGWAKFCSMSCKAKEQEHRTGQYRSFAARQVANNHGLLRNLKAKDCKVAYDTDGSFVYINGFGGWDDHK